MNTQLQRKLPGITIAYAKCIALFTTACLLLLNANAAPTTINQSFDVASGGQLTVEAESTKIEVRGNDNAHLTITISRGDDSEQDIRDDYDIELSQSGNTVQVSIQRLHRFSFRHTRSLKLEITVPRQFDLDLDSSGGRIDIANVSGEIQSRTSGGSLHFIDVAGVIQGKTSGGSIELSGRPQTADLKTSGGSIRIGMVEGDVFAHTSGGSIFIDGAKGSVIASTSGGSIKIGEAHGKIRATTSGGKIVAHLPGQLLADSKLSTSGGSVTVYLGSSVALNIDAQTSGGRVHNDLPVRVSGTKSKNSLKGELNGGGPELYLRASGGSINLREI